MKKLILPLILLFFTQIIFAQEDSTKWKFNYDFEASGLHISPLFSSKEIRIDPVIFKKRRRNNLFNPRRGLVTDNPNFHTAAYIGVKLGTTFRDKYKFQSNLYFEDRGASYGVGDRDNLVWFPQFKFSAIDTFLILKKNIVMEVEAGNFVQAQLNNGLKIYNLDYQGINFKISHRNLYIEYHQIGDLSNGIGLELEEYVQISLGFENERLAVKFSPSRNLSGNNFKYEDYWGADISANYFFNETDEVYFQYGHRFFDGFNLSQNGAFVLGAKYSVIYNNTITWDVNPSLRYYSANYNEGHYNPGFTHRDPTKGYYSNTAGRFLYPLRNYYYDFDQWAVHTEYQEENIYSLALKTNLDWKVRKRFGINTNVETLSIRREAAFYTNYFYAIDFYYTVRKDFRFGILVSNKTYNLDASFPTFYMMQEPMVGFHLKLNTIR